MRKATVRTPIEGISTRKSRMWRVDNAGDGRSGVEGDVERVFVVEVLHSELFGDAMRFGTREQGSRTQLMR
jgi:hypothetical protein